MSTTAEKKPFTYFPSETSRTVPGTTFRTRVRNEALDGDNPFEWKELTSADIFKGKRVVLFHCPAPLPRRVPPATCPATKNCTANSQPMASIR